MIQNFIKRGNLGPLTDKESVTTRNNSLEVDRIKMDSQSLDFEANLGKNEHNSLL